MTETPAPCVPPQWPQLDDNRSAHWLERFGERSVMMWDGQFWPTASGALSSQEMQAAGYRYHSPVPAPEEVEALRRVVLNMWESANQVASENMVAMGLADYDGNKDYVLTPLGRRALGVEG